MEERETFETRLGRWANINRKPIVFDPVGIGSSMYRQSSAKG